MAHQLLHELDEHAFRIHHCTIQFQEIYGASMSWTIICVKLCQQAPDELMGMEGMHQFNPSTAPETFADFWVVLTDPLHDGFHPNVAYCSKHLKWKGMVFLVDQLNQTSWAVTLILKVMKHDCQISIL